MLRARGWSPAPRAGARAQQRLDERRARLDHVLAVVEDQEQPARRASAAARSSRGGREATSWRPIADATACATSPASGTVAQLDEPDAVRMPLTELRARRQGEPGLADASGAEERHHAVGAEEAVDVAELLLPADEARDREGDRHRRSLR